MPDYTPLNVIGARSPLLQQARQAMALRMLQSGMSTAPIQSPLQGVARMAQSLFGGMALRRLADQQSAGTNAFLNGIFSSGGTPTTPSVAQPAPSVAPQSGPSIPPEALSPTSMQNTPAPLSGGTIPQNSAALTGAVAKLESGNSPVNGPAGGYANYRFQQFPAFVKQYGSGADGVVNYARQVLAANPNATFGDMYGGYVTGTGDPATAKEVSLQTTTQPGARGAYANLVHNSPIDPKTPLSQLLQYPNLASGADAQKLFGPVPIGKTTPSGLNFPNTVSAPQALAFNGIPQSTNPLANVQAFAPQPSPAPAPMPQPSAGGFQPAPLPHTVEMMRTQPVQLPIGGQPVARQQVPAQAQGGTFGVPPRVQHLIRGAVTSGNPQLQAMGWKMLGNYLAPKGYQLEQMPNGDVVAFEKGNPSNAKVVYRGGAKPTNDMTNFEYSRTHPGFDQFLNPPKPTTDITNFEYSQRHPGFQGYQIGVKNAGRPVNLGPAPKGYMYVPGADGTYSLKPITGGPAAQSQTEQEGAKQTTTDVVSNAYKTAKGLIGSNTTGVIGKGLGAILPPSDAAELRRQVHVLMSNASISALNAMRRQSKTGGALGNVTEAEERILAATAGAINPDSSPEQFKAQLDNYYHTLLRIVNGPEAGDRMFEQMQRSGGASGGLPPGWSVQVK